MTKQIFFNASLPRAGSTLIQNILMQNPEIYSTPTSGVIEFLLQARTIYTTGDAFKAQDPEVMKSGFKGFLNGGIQGFFNGVTNRPYVMEKSRGWLGHYEFIKFFNGDVKMICMVRDLRAIFASMEKNMRKNPDKDSMIVNNLELKNMTTKSRIDHFSLTPPIGPSLEWLSEVIHQGLDKNILFIRFEDLTTNPEIELKKIYDYLEIPQYLHNFNNIEQLTQENDIIHGMFGNHTIQPKLEPVVNDFMEVLGVEECARLKDHYNWYFKKFNYV